MIIVFTGHRNCETEVSELDALAQKYPDALWLHGGAIGFDTQVQTYAVAHNIVWEIKRPDYKTYPPKYAPILRNHQMVDRAGLLVACWDGRTTGGTYDTIQYAKTKGVEVIYVSCRPIPIVIKRYIDMPFPRMIDKITN